MKLGRDIVSGKFTKEALHVIKCTSLQLFQLRQWVNHWRRESSSELFLAEKFSAGSPLHAVAEVTFCGAFDNCRRKSRSNDILNFDQDVGWVIRGHNDEGCVRFCITLNERSVLLGVEMQFLPRLMAHSVFDVDFFDENWDAYV